MTDPDYLSRAPWNHDQVQSLNDYQVSSVFHPFTCPNRAANHRFDGQLKATLAGWVCLSCEYRQDWAHVWMVDGMWREWAAAQMDLFRNRNEERRAKRSGV